MVWDVEEKFELEFSEDALLARVLLLISDNGINFFVEDSYKEYEYEEIFEKLFSEEINICNIFSTGGKPKLEEVFSIYGNCPEYKTFFIADGDFDIALNKNMIIADNFVYLNRYNIESYLLNEEAVYTFMRRKLKKTKADTKNTIDYKLWITTMTPFFKELFVIHCLAQKYVPDIKNVARGPARFLNSDGMPNVEKLQSYKEEIKAMISNYDTEFLQMQNVLKSIYGDSTGCYECGKYYVFSLKKYLDTFVRKNIKEEDLRAALINMIDISQLGYVKEQLYSYI